MSKFLHTMIRITDFARSRGFYEALGFTFSRELDIVRDGELEATSYFFSLGDSENVLELTYNHDGRTYDLGTAYGHIAIGVGDLGQTLARLKEQGIEPERPPYTVREVDLPLVASGGIADGAGVALHWPRARVQHKSAPASCSARRPRPALPIETRSPVPAEPR
jgi:lactoylglutathione lyase